MCGMSSVLVVVCIVFSWLLRGRGIRIFRTSESNDNYLMFTVYLFVITMTKKNHEINIPKEKILQDLKDTAEKVDGILTVKKYNEHGKYSNAVVHSKEWGRWDSWNEAKEDAGLETAEPGNNKEYTDEEIKSELRRVWMEHGSPLTREKIEEHAEMSAQTISYRYGDIETALKEAEIEDLPILFQRWENKLKGKYGRYTIQELEELLDNFNYLYFKNFKKWLEEKENPEIEIKNPSLNSNKGVRQMFIKTVGEDFQQVMDKRYGEHIPEEYEELFYHYISQGKSPKTIVGTIEYLNTDKTQEEVEWCSQVSIRNFIRTMKEDGFDDLVPEGYRQKDKEVYH